MKKGIGTGIIVTLGIVLIIINPLVMGVLAIPTWIYLVLSVRKQQDKSSHGQVELQPMFFEKQWKIFKTFMLTAGITFLVALAGILLHNFGPDLLDINESISFFIGVGALYVFIFATAGGLILFLKARQKSTL
jgi:hypothetical protein